MSVFQRLHAQMRIANRLLPIESQLDVPDDTPTHTDTDTHVDVESDDDDVDGKRTTRDEVVVLTGKVEAMRLELEEAKGEMGGMTSRAHVYACWYAGAVPLHVGECGVCYLCADMHLIMFSSHHRA